MNNGLMSGLPPSRGAAGMGPGGLGPGPLPPTPPSITGMLNGLAFGMEQSGASCNAQAMMNALQASLDSAGKTGYPFITGYPATNAGYAMPNQGLYIPPGLYMFNRTVDFSKLVCASSPIANWQIVCDPGAVFLAGPGLGASPLINLTPPANVSIEQSYIQFGTLISPTAAVAGQIGIQSASVADSRIVIYQVWGFAGEGILINSAGAFAPYGNNHMWIQLISSNGVGFQTQGTSGSPQGFQGNIVFLGDLIDNTSHGVFIDATSTSGQVGSSQYNEFHASAIEHNGGFGVVDYNGANMYFLETNSNTSGGVKFGNTALALGHVPYVRGYLSDTTPITTNGNTTDIRNLGGPMAPPPTFPAQVIPAAATYLGTGWTIPANTMTVGDRYRITYDCTNAATADATLSLIAKAGPNGTTADTSIVTVAVGAGTAAAGFSEIIVEFTVKTLSATVGAIYAKAMVRANGTTGFTGTTTPMGSALVSTFNTTANIVLGASLTPATASVVTVQMVNYELVGGRH